MDEDPRMLDRRDGEAARSRQETADLAAATDRPLPERSPEHGLPPNSAITTWCEQSPVMAGILALDGTCLYANPTACAFAEIGLADVVGRPVWDTPWWQHSEEERERLKAAVAEAARGPVRLGSGHLAHDGSLRQVDMALWPLLGDDGSPAFLAVEGRDVTDLHEQARDLQRANDLLRAVIEAAPAAIVGLDLDGVVRSVWNPAAESILGWSADAAIGRTLPFIPTDVEARLELLRDWIGRGTALQGHEVTCRTQDGRHVDCGIYASPLRGQGGEAVGTVMVMLDLTERRAAEKALREKTDELDRYFTQALDLLCIADLDGRFRRVNREWEAVLGYPAGELEGARFLDFVHPDDMDATLSALARLRAQEEVLDFTNRYRAKDGSYRWVEWRSFPAGDLVYSAARDVTERRQVEEALHASRAFLDTVIENSPNSMWISDERGTMIRMNQACRDLLHITDEEVVGKYNLFQDSVVEQQGAMHHIRRVFEEGRPVRFMLHWDGAQLRPLALPDAADVVVDVSIAPVVGAGGHVTNAIVQHYDLSERVRAERAREALYRRLRMRSECSDSLVHATDQSALVSAICESVTRTGRYRLAWVGFAEGADARSIRPAAQAGVDAGYVAEVYGRPDAELGAGDPVLQALAAGRPFIVEVPDVAEGGVPWRDAALRRGCRAACILPLLTDGAVLGVLSVYAASPDQLGGDEVAHLEQIAADLAYGIVALRTRADHARATEQLRASEERFRRLVQNSSDMVTVADEQCAVLFTGGAVERILGFRAEEFIGTVGMDLVHPEDAAQVAAAFTSVVAHPGATQRSEYRYRHRDGHYVWLETVGANLIGVPGIDGIVMNSRDVTERRAAEQERRDLQDRLQQAMKMEAVGRLAGGVAHDFNNLLTVILGNVDLARMDPSATDTIRLKLEPVSRAAGSATALTRQLLAFSRRQVVEPKVLDLNDLVDGLKTMLARLIGEDVEMTFTPSPELLSVSVDPSQFEQVLVNLAVNARDAMPRGGRLAIETQNVDLDEAFCARHPRLGPGPHARLVVRDTGLGMSEEVKQHLFEPFYTTKPKGRGTGLGMATIFGVVEQAGGAIDVLSEVGQGTTVSIYLPAASTPPDVAGADDADGPPHGTETVLLAEDDEHVRGLTTCFLEQLGYQVLVAVNGADALTQAQAHNGPIDLLLTDVVMPGMNGRELADRLTDQHPETKVLFSSGYTGDVMLHHGVADESVHFIAKPFTMQALAAKVRAAIDDPPPA